MSLEIDDDSFEQVEIIDLDASADTPEDEIYQWNIGIFKKFAKLLNNSKNRQDFSNLFVDYLKNTQDIVKKFKDNKILSNVIFSQIRVLYSYYVDLDYYHTSIYLKYMEDIMTIFCNLEAHLIFSLKIKQLKKKEITAIVIESTRRIVHTLKFYLLNSEKHVMHVLLKLANFPCYQNNKPSKEFFNIIYNSFLSKKIPCVNDETFCRVYILFQKWKEIHKDSEWALMDKLIYNITDKDPNYVKTNTLLTRLIRTSQNSASDLSYIFSPSQSLIRVYFEEMYKLECEENNSNDDDDIEIVDISNNELFDFFCKSPSQESSEKFIEEILTDDDQAIMSEKFEQILLEDVKNLNDSSDDEDDDCNSNILNKIINEINLDNIKNNSNNAINDISNNQFELLISTTNTISSVSSTIETSIKSTPSTMSTTTPTVTTLKTMVTSTLTTAITSTTSTTLTSTSISTITTTTTTKTTTTATTATTTSTSTSISTITTTTNSSTNTTTTTTNDNDITKENDIDNDNPLSEFSKVLKESENNYSSESILNQFDEFLKKSISHLNDDINTLKDKESNGTHYESSCYALTPPSDSASDAPGDEQVIHPVGSIGNCNYNERVICLPYVTEETILNRSKTMNITNTNITTTVTSINGSPVTTCTMITSSNPEIINDNITCNSVNKNNKNSHSNILITTTITTDIISTSNDITISSNSNINTANINNIITTNKNDTDIVTTLTTDKTRTTSISPIRIPIPIPIPINSPPIQNTQLNHTRLQDFTALVTQLNDSMLSFFNNHQQHQGTNKLQFVENNDIVRRPLRNRSNRNNNNILKRTSEILKCSTLELTTAKTMREYQLNNEKNKKKQNNTTINEHTLRKRKEKKKPVKKTKKLKPSKIEEAAAKAAAITSLQTTTCHLKNNYESFIKADPKLGMFPYVPLRKLERSLRKLSLGTLRVDYDKSTPYLNEYDRIRFTITPSDDDTGTPETSFNSHLEKKPKKRKRSLSPEVEIRKKRGRKRKNR